MYWVLNWPEFTVVPLLLPDAEYISQLSQIVRFDYESFSSHENKIRKDLFRYQVVVDAQGRSASPSYVRIKPPPPETLRMVFKKVEGTALEMSKLDWGCREYEFAGAASLLLHQPVNVAGTTAHAYKVSDGRVRLVFSANDDVVLPRRVTLWQEQSDCTAQGIGSALTNFWSDYWSRDSREEEWDLEQWPQFQALLRGHASPCANLPVNMGDLAAWKHAVRNFRARRQLGSVAGTTLTSASCRNQQ